jgi:pimeloyl-ACP methyl ester carboxylesterase
MTAPGDLQSFALSNGRRFAWHEYGDPAGAPCLYLTGTPASGLAGAGFHDVAVDAGVRLISIDKPGYGASDFDPHRSLFSAADESRQLADHLDLDRFAVLGQSGGGPFALATAFAIPERITTAVIACGLAPWGLGLELKPPMQGGLRVMMRLARSAPLLLRPLIGAMRRQVEHPDIEMTKLEEGLAKAVPAERDSALVRTATLATIPAIREALANGPDAAIQELRIVTREWGFSRADIRCHVDILHGELDTNVPVANARSNAAAIPDSSLEIFPDLAHSASAAQAPRILQLVAGAAATA